MNVELHGFNPDGVNQMVEEIWSKLIGFYGVDVELNQFVVTVVPVTTSDVHGRIAPFFRVYSDKTNDFRSVLELLRQVRAPGAGMKTCVEFVLLERCVVL